MKEYIEREAAITAVTGWSTDPTDEELEWTLNNVPTADVVEVKHGEWIKHDCLTNDGTGNYTVKVGEIWVCSVCGRDEKYREPYCHCGAKMDGE